MASRPTVEVVITSDVKDLNRGISETKDHVGKLGAIAGATSALVSAGLTAMATAAGKAVDFLKDSVKAASNLEQASGAVESVFREQAKTIDKWSKESAKALGLSEREYKELAAVAGAQLKGMGVPLKDTAKLTNDLMKRAADMAATFGGTTADAMQAIAALMRGERDPIEKYGVSLKQVDINARLAAKGQSKLTGTAKSQAEATAALDILFGKTADSAGQFARENKSLAGRTQIATAQLENMKAAIGQKLMPIVLKLWDVFQEKLVPILRDLWEWIKEKLTPTVLNVRDAFLKLWSLIVDKLWPVVKTLIETYLKVLIGYWQILTDTLNTKVIPAVSAVVDWVGKQLKVVLDEVKDAINLHLIPAYKNLSDAVSGNTGRTEDLGGAYATLSNALSRIKDGFTVVWDLIQNRLWPILQPFVDVWWHLIEAIMAMWSWLAGRLVPIFEHMWHVISDNLWPAIQKLWDAISALLIPVFQVWWSIMSGAILPLIGWIADSLRGPLKTSIDVVAAVGRWLIDHVLTVFVTMFDAIMTSIRLTVNLLTWMADETRKAFGQVTGYFQGALDTIKQIVDWISKIKFPSAPSWLGKIPGFAGGVTNFSGGLALVGERGPELAMLPRGTSVVPNGQTQQLLKGGSSVINLHIDLGGEVIKRQVRVELASHDRALARRIKARG